MPTCTGNQTTGGIGIGGLTIPGVSGFLTEWMPLLLNVWLTYEMLDAQEDAEEAMEEIAQNSLDAAEELFDDYMDKRDLDQEIYDFQNNQELYTACNRDRHAIQSGRQASAFIQETMSKASRFDCGAKQKAIRASQRALIIGTKAEMETMSQFELTLEDQYLEHHYGAMIGAAGNQTPNIAGNFNQSAALWGAQYEAANANVAGSVASATYFGSSALTGLFNGGGNSGNFGVGLNSGPGAGYYTGI